MTEAFVSRSGRANAALAHLPEVDAALASLAIWCDMRDAKDAFTYTSGDVIFVGSSLEQMPLQEQIGLLGRHILHVALRHENALCQMQARLGRSFKPHLYILCCNAIVNEYLLRGGHALPRPAVLLRDFLPAVLNETQSVSQDPLPHLTADKLYLKVTTNDPQAVETAKEFGEGKAFEPDIFPNVPDPDVDPDAPDWHAHLIRAYQAGGGAGRGIGSFLRSLRTTVQSRTPWEQRLRGLVAKAVCHAPRQSFRRPRATWIARDADAFSKATPRPVFEPAQLRHTLRPRIVVGVDTSGSVTPDMLSLFAGEVSGVARKSGAETHVLLFDDDVYADTIVETFDAHSIFDKLTFRGEGGTSFVDLIARAEKLSPSIMIVLTDGAGQFGQPPSCRVVWASAKPMPKPPPFGEVLDLAQ